MQHESTIYKHCKKMSRLEGEPLRLLFQYLLPQLSARSLMAPIYISDEAAWPEALLH